MTPQSKHIVAFVDMVPSQAADEVKKHIPNSKILLLRDVVHRLRDARQKKVYPVDILEYVDFTQPYKLAEAIKPYQDKLLAITARGENGASRLSKVVPHVPYLRTPTSDSLEWALDKYQMRRKLNQFDSKICPKFTKVKGNTRVERQRIIAKVGFPMVVKPANLEASMLVTICYHEDELAQALKNVMRKLKKQYEDNGRVQEPVVLAESYMEGDMYSIDSYIDSRGKVWHCPLVRVKTGKDIGHDDFYNYLQITPSALKKETVERARLTTEKAIKALGLRSITSHIELMKLDDEWKVIEVGPRIGGYRPLLYELSCDINHSLNDVYIRLPKKPIVPKKCKGYAALMKWFAPKEGVITEMKGVKKIESLTSFHSITINKKIGDKALFSKNGGRSIFNVVMYNKDRSKLLADIRRIEKLVDVKVVGRKNKKANN
ncbi:hypothetical protein CL653_02865 [bacterium]|nr:hypothetical protein [bacterium]